MNPRSSFRTTYLHFFIHVCVCMCTYRVFLIERKPNNKDKLYV